MAQIIDLQIRRHSRTSAFKPHAEALKASDALHELIEIEAPLIELEQALSALHSALRAYGLTKLPR